MDTRPEYPIETLTLTPQPALVARVRVPPEELAATLERLFPALIAHAYLHGVELAGPPFARYHQRTPERVDVEAGVPTRTRAEGDPAQGIEPGALPAGAAIATVHQGPYEGLPAAHAALAAWAEDHGRSAGGAPWEVFLTNPAQEPDPARRRTKVFLPLADRAAR